MQLFVETCLLTEVVDLANNLEIIVDSTSTAVLLHLGSMSKDVEFYPLQLVNHH